MSYFIVCCFCGDNIKVSSVLFSTCICIFLFCFYFMYTSSLSLMAQTLPGQPVAVPHQNHKAAGRDCAGDTCYSNAQDHVCPGTLCQ